MAVQYFYFKHTHSSSQSAVIVTGRLLTPFDIAKIIISSAMIVVDCLSLEVKIILTEVKSGFFKIKGFLFYRQKM